VGASTDGTPPLHTPLPLSFITVISFFSITITIILAHGTIGARTLYAPLTESSVVAATVSAVSQEAYNNAAFALYQATQSEGPGIFAEVTYVQRLFTKDGLPPSGACPDASAKSPYGPLPLFVVFVLCVNSELKWVKPAGLTSSLS
jgi:hypothetical protein